MGPKSWFSALPMLLFYLTTTFQARCLFETLEGMAEADFVALPQVALAATDYVIQS